MFRILHAAETVKGGIASYFEEINRAQCQAFGKENVKYLVPKDQAYCVEGLNTIVFDRSGSIYHFAKGLIGALREFNPHITHLHASYAGAVGRPIVKMFAPWVRIVYCPHGWSFFTGVPVSCKVLYWLIEQCLRPLTDVTINISNYENEHGISGRVIHNGIAPIIYSQKCKNLFDPTKINLLFVGRFDRQKGLDILFEAMELCHSKDVVLHVIGDFVRDRDIAFRYPPNVIMHGWVPRAELNSCFEEADAVVMPSRWEAFGLVALEAMRASTPVFASDRGALPEVVGDTLPLDPQAFCDAFCWSTKEALAEKGKSARSRFLKNFTSGRMNQELLAVYAELLK